MYENALSQSAVQQGPLIHRDTVLGVCVGAGLTEHISASSDKVCVVCAIDSHARMCFHATRALSFGAVVHAAPICI